MASRKNHVLLVDDDPCHAKAFEEALLVADDGPWNLGWARTLAQGLEKAESKEVRAIFLNLFLSDSRGVDTLDRVLSANSAGPARGCRAVREVTGNAGSATVWKSRPDSRSPGREAASSVSLKPALSPSFTGQETL